MHISCLHRRMIAISIIHAPRHHPAMQLIRQINVLINVTLVSGGWCLGLQNQFVHYFAKILSRRHQFAYEHFEGRKKMSIHIVYPDWSTEEEEEDQSDGDDDDWAEEEED